MSKISIVVPIYNDEKYLSETLDSILTQTFKEFEVVCMDDCSNDKTPEILNEYQKRDSRIRVYRTSKNQGCPAGTRNEALKYLSSSSKYVALLDHDDLMKPNRLRLQWDFMEKNPDIQASGGYMEYFGNKKGVVKEPLKNPDIEENFIIMSPILNPTAIIRKEIFLQKGYIWDDTLQGSDDYDFWAKLILGGEKLANIPEILISYRVHENNVHITKNKELQIENKNIQRYYMKNISFKLKVKIYLKLLPKKVKLIRRWLINIRINKNEKIVKILGLYLYKK